MLSAYIKKRPSHFFDLLYRSFWAAEARTYNSTGDSRCLFTIMNVKNFTVPKHPSKFSPDWNFFAYSLCKQARERKKDTRRRWRRRRHRQAIYMLLKFCASHCIYVFVCFCNFHYLPFPPAYGLMTVAGALLSQTVYPSANCCVAFLCLIVQRQKSEKSLNTYSGKVNKGPTNLSTMNRRATAAEEMTPKNWDDLCWCWPRWRFYLDTKECASVNENYEKWAQVLLKFL